MESMTYIYICSSDLKITKRVCGLGFEQFFVWLLFIRQYHLHCLFLVICTDVDKIYKAASWVPRKGSVGGQMDFATFVNALHLVAAKTSFKQNASPAIMTGMLEKIIKS